MNKFLLPILLVLSITAFAQDKAPSVTKADKLRKSGNLGEAKALVDQAIEHEKTKGKAKTWYYRGLVYMDLANSGSGKAIDNHVQAGAAFNKVMELDNESGYFYGESSKLTEDKWRTSVEPGIEAYNDNNFDKAISDFNVAVAYKPNDPQAVFLRAHSAQMKQEYTQALEYYKDVERVGFENAKIGRAYISCLFKADVAPEKIVTACEKLIKQFPDEPKFQEHKIAGLILGNKAEEAEAQIKEGLAKDPQNLQLNLQLAKIYDGNRIFYYNEKQDDKMQEFLDKTTETYANILTFAPEDLTANFNYAAMLNFKANIFFQEYNNLSLKDFETKGPIIQEKGMSLLRKGLPHMEKAYQLASDNKDIISGLRIYYERLSIEKEEYKAKAKELEALLK